MHNYCGEVFSLSYNPEQLLLSQTPSDFLKFFEARKETRLEGLVVEFETEQTLLKEFIKNKWRVIDAMVLRGRIQSKVGSPFLIFPRNKSAETRDDITALVAELEKTGQPIFTVTVRQNKVYLIISEGKGINLPSNPKNNESPGNNTRILSMFWGFAVHTPEHFCRFARDMVMKDCFIQPSFNAGLWDLDRFLISPGRERIVYIETKHKYPINKSYLPFGMNLGEIETLDMLKKTDLYCWHTVLSKPQWKKDISSTYLFYNREAREKALWLAADMKSDDFIRNKQSYTASKSTSINHKSDLDFKELNSSTFFVIGENSLTSEALSKNFYNVVCQYNHECSKVTPKILKDHRIQ